MNKEMIEIAKNMIATGLVKRDGDSWLVDEQIVLNRITNGSSSLSCSCQNASLYPNSDCQHKISVIIFESQGKFNQVAEALVKKYEGYKKIKILPQEPYDCFIEDIKLLRYAK